MPGPPSLGVPQGQWPCPGFRARKPSGTVAVPRPPSPETPQGLVPARPSLTEEESNGEPGRERSGVGVDSLPAPWLPGAHLPRAGRLVINKAQTDRLLISWSRWVLPGRQGTGSLLETLNEN